MWQILRLRYDSALVPRTLVVGWALPTNGFSCGGRCPPYVGKRFVDYQLKTIGKTCAGTGELLKAGTTCHSVLVDRDGELLRLDYSEEGWKGPPEDSVGEWLAIVPDDTPKPKVIDTEALMRYFEQLSEDPNPAHDQMHYVLALLLLQKRRLRFDGQRTDEDGNEFLQVIGSKSEGPYEVADQELDDTEIANLQAALNAQLEAELI
ncbi:MAG: hypothetical protein ACI92S_001782 [Planctomycetaceae bacterium]